MAVAIKSTRGPNQLNCPCPLINIINLYKRKATNKISNKFISLINEIIPLTRAHPKSVFSIISDIKPCLNIYHYYIVYSDIPLKPFIFLLKQNKFD